MSSPPLKPSPSSSQGTTGSSRSSAIEPGLPHRVDFDDIGLDPGILIGLTDDGGHHMYNERRYYEERTGAMPAGHSAYANNRVVQRALKYLWLQARGQWTGQSVGDVVMLPRMAYERRQRGPMDGPSGSSDNGSVIYQLDPQLEQYMTATSETSFAINRIKVIDACVGNSMTTPRDDLGASGTTHRVIGLRLEGMNEMGWVFCRQEQYQATPGEENSEHEQQHSATPFVDPADSDGFGDVTAVRWLDVVLTKHQDIL